MIKEGRHSIDVIAQQTGFADRNRMRRAFLRAFGQSPQVIRRSARAEALTRRDARQHSGHRYPRTDCHCPRRSVSYRWLFLFCDPLGFPREFDPRMKLNTGWGCPGAVACKSAGILTAASAYSASAAGDMPSAHSK